MDILKVLTRSTNLGKKSSVGPGQHKRDLPSNGAPSHPQALAEPHSEAFAQTSRGLKRKRGGAKAGPIDVDVPDFFGSARSITESQDVQDESDGEIDVIPAENVATPQGNTMDPEECRHLLRRHKLKVHIVSGGIRKKSKEGKDKRRKKETVSTKDGPLYEASYPQPILSFKELRQTPISKQVLHNLSDQGYTVPTEVQMAALPILLGRENGLASRSSQENTHVDLMTVAPTGSGKTLAFLMPIMNDLLASRSADGEAGGRHVRAIILAPTHELVDQITNEARKLAEGTGVKAAAMQKGMYLYQGSEATGSGTPIKSDIVVSTPMLLANVLNAGVGGKPDAEETRFPRTLPKITHLVLDEADVLLDPLFKEQTMSTWDSCTLPSLRVSLWSATMGASIESFATEYIFDRLAKADKETQKGHKLVRVIAGLKDSAIPNVKHHLTYAASEQGKLLAMRHLLHPATNTVSSDPVVRPPFLVFTQTIPRAVALHSELLYDIPAEAGGSFRIAVLHSDLSLSSRSDIMARFRKGEIWVLITTDLLSRGVDFRGVNGVVNYDIPTSGAGYVHRAGRTGRAGREGGICVTLYTKDDIPYVKSIANVIAAAEKLKGKKLGGEGSAMPQWLLDALPDLSKKTKADLKRKGVAARRSEKGGKVDGKGKMRISTKSGYDRKLEHRRKAAKMNEAQREKPQAATNLGVDDDFGGFDD